VEKNNTLKKEDIEEIGKAAEVEVKEAIAFAKKSPYPKKNEMAQYVFKQ
jgi:TPP-dependent pyruvate/acetoin dehydrogenase alpha subunit